MSELFAGRGRRGESPLFPGRLTPRIGWAALGLIALGLITLGLVGAGTLAASDTPYEQEPISYSDPVLDDPVSKLGAALEAGTQVLEYEPGRGYLRSVLRALRIPESSQTLVFSKTSFQRDRIAQIGRAHV